MPFLCGDSQQSKQKGEDGEFAETRTDDGPRRSDDSILDGFGLVIWVRYVFRVDTKSICGAGRH